MLRVLWTMALDGDRGAARFIADYTEGLPARQAPRAERKRDKAGPSADDMLEQLRRFAQEDEPCSDEGAETPRSEKSG